MPFCTPQNMRLSPIINIEQPSPVGRVTSNTSSEFRCGGHDEQITTTHGKQLTKQKITQYNAQNGNGNFELCFPDQRRRLFCGVVLSVTVVSYMALCMCSDFTKHFVVCTIITVSVLKCDGYDAATVRAAPAVRCM